MVESKDAQEVSNPHYYNVSIKDCDVKSKDGHKALLQKDKSSELCPTQEESTVATDAPSIDETLGNTMTNTNAFSESTTDDNLQCEDVSNPCYTQTPSENVYDTVSNINMTEAHKKTERDSPKHHQQDKDSTSEKQIPNHAVVDKTKKNSKAKFSQMQSTPPTDKSPSDSEDELYATAEEYIYRNVRERSPSPQYTKVMAGKGAKEKSTMEACAMDIKSTDKEGLLVHRYNKVAKVQKKDEVEQYYYYSLENPAESYTAEVESIKDISHSTCAGKVNHCIPQVYNSELDVYYDSYTSHLRTN